MVGGSKRLKGPPDSKSLWAVMLFCRFSSRFAILVRILPFWWCGVGGVGGVGVN